MSRLIDYITAHAWALDGRVVDNGLALIQRHTRGEKASAEQIAGVIAARDGARSESLASRPWDGKLGVPEDGRPPTEEQQQGYIIQDGVAVIPVEGVLTRWASLVNGASQPRGTSAQAVVSALRNAAADSRVKAIVMEIDSPGGTVGGTEEMSLAVREARKDKPVVAWGAYLVCSGAYWLASQADAIVASNTALIGNIGVYQVLQDSSAQAASEGVKVLVVKAGEFKAIGVAGASVTESQLAEVQREIDGTYRQFIEAAASGRRMSASSMQNLADGRSHIGREAVILGLADSVGSLEDAITLALKRSEKTASSNQTPSRARSSKMNLNDLKASQPGLLAEFKTEVLAEAAKGESDRQAAAVKTAVDKALADEKAKKPAAATRAELKLIVPATMAGREDLIGELQDKSATAAEAQAAVVAKLDEQNKALAAKVEEVQKAGKVLGNAGKGVNPLAFVPGAEAGDDKFAALVQSIVTAEKCSVNIAMAKAQAKDPALHRDWVDRGCPKINAA